MPKRCDYINDTGDGFNNCDGTGILTKYVWSEEEQDEIPWEKDCPKCNGRGLIWTKEETERITDMLEFINGAMWEDEEFFKFMDIIIKKW